MNRKKNIYNILVSIISQLVLLVLGIIVPRIILTHYGSDTNGVTSTITQIFAYMALLEAGIGQSTRNALYPYLDNKNKNIDKICEIFSISRRYYRKISVVYFLVVIALSFVLPLLLKSNLSYFTILGVVLFEGATGVVSFYFIQSWATLLASDGKQYVVSNIDLISRLLCYIVKVVLAILGVNIVYIQFGYFLVSLIKFSIYYLYVKKKYTWIKPFKTSKGQKLKDRNSYIITELAWTVFSSTDLIVLSTICSASLASVYSIYNMIYVALNGLLSAVFNSISYNLGQMYHKNMEEYVKLHDAFNTFFMTLITILMICSYVFTLSFVKIYTKGVYDVNYIYPKLPLFFCIVQLLSWSRYVSGNLTGVAGFAKRISKISLVEAFLNVFFSLLFASPYGIYGVIMATVLALPFKVFYCNYLSDKIIMKRSPINTIKIIGVNWTCFAVVVILVHNVSIQVNSFLELLIKAGITFVIVVFGITGINLLFNRQAFSSFIMIFRR